MELHFVEGLLDQEEIEYVVQGEALEAAWSNVALSQTAVPGIWVKPEDVARAKAIVEDYLKREQKYVGQDAIDETPRKTWKCAKCGEEVEEQFDQCWNCGAEKPEANAPAAQ